MNKYCSGVEMMSESPGKKTCENSDNFTFEAVPDARDKENSAKNRGFQISNGTGTLRASICP